MKTLITLSLFLVIVCSTSTLIAQRTITGKIQEANGQPIVGATVMASGTSTGTTTNEAGLFTLQIPANVTSLTVSYIGYAPKEVIIGDALTIDIVLEEGKILETVFIIGSRSTATRTKTETTAPVDVLNITELISTGQTDPTQMLHYIVPSFNSGRQTVADGTDHIDPSTLRGLGPDQVLTLLNGKRRHNQALININGTIGRGSVGTDMNAIPSAAIERLEVLRDGASSQYGSDAIAGVINVVLKNTPGTTISAYSGSYNSRYENKFGKDEKRHMSDGETMQFSGYHGMALGKGKFSVALEYRDRKPSNRAGDYLGTVYNASKSVDDSLINANGGFDRTFNMQVGNASSRNLLGFVNFNLPIGTNKELYLNIGGASRKGAGKGFYRYPKQNTQVIPELYPRGFLPEIHSTIGDFSALTGIKGMVSNGWRWDLSNVFGTNRFRYDVKNSNNASQFALKTSAPTEFYAGTQQFTQNTTNFEVSKELKSNAVRTLNVALGLELRIDQFKIEAGEEASWKNYDLNATPLRVGGAQVFPGFQPGNEVNQGRTVAGAFIDLESDVTEKLLINAAARFENYSDFGTNAAAKLAVRYKFADAFVVRGALSNGFRAPSVHQRYFSNTSTQFVVANGVTTPNNVGTYRNDSEIAKALGIPSLEAEKSTNISLGVTSKFAQVVSLTIDAYQINIKDRIVITGNMSRSNALINSLLIAGGAAADVTQVAFFTNAINTRTTGIDAVMGASPKLGNGFLDLTLAANFTKNEIDGDPKTTDKLPADQFGKTFFSRLEESRIVVGQPRSKIATAVGYRIGKLATQLRATRFGEVAVWDNTNIALDESFSPKTIVDLNIAYTFKKATLSVGSTNLFDTYPDKIKNLGNTSDGRFIYSRNVTQFGFGGRTLYTALKFDIL